MKIKKLLKKYTTNSIDDNCYYNAEDMIDFAKYVLKEKLTLTDVVASLPSKKEIDLEANRQAMFKNIFGEERQSLSKYLGFMNCVNWYAEKMKK